MVRGRGVNPSYRTVQAALENGSTFRSVGSTGSAIVADSIAFADSRFRFQCGASWSIATQQYGICTFRLGVLRSVGNIRTDSSLPYSFGVKGSIRARMRTKGRIRTGA